MNQKNYSFWIFFLMVGIVLHSNAQVFQNEKLENSDGDYIIRLVLKHPMLQSYNNEPWGELKKSSYPIMICGTIFHMNGSYYVQYLDKNIKLYDSENTKLVLPSFYHIITGIYYDAPLNCLTSVYIDGCPIIYFHKRESYEAEQIIRKTGTIHKLSSAIDKYGYYLMEANNKDVYLLEGLSELDEKVKMSLCEVSGKRGEYNIDGVSWPTITEIYIGEKPFSVYSSRYLNNYFSGTGRIICFKDKDSFICYGLKMKNKKCIYLNRSFIELTEDILYREVHISGTYEDETKQSISDIRINGLPIEHYNINSNFETNIVTLEGTIQKIGDDDIKSYYRLLLDNGKTIALKEATNLSENVLNKKIRIMGIYQDYPLNSLIYAYLNNIPLPYYNGKNLE